MRVWERHAMCELALRKQAEVQNEGSHNCTIRICLLGVDSDKFTFAFFLLYSGHYAKVYRTVLAYGGRAGKASLVLSLDI